jgi:peptidoglycan/LPS O-acetylase OafA/YrhL
VAGQPHRADQLGYFSCFLLGGAIRYANPFADLRLARVIASVALLALIGFRMLFQIVSTGAPQPITINYLAASPAFVETLSAGVLVAIVSNGPFRDTWLTRRPIIWLGDVSYSLYLLHFPIALATAKLIGVGLPWLGSAQAALLVLLTAMPLTLLLSHWSYRWIELPFIAMGSRASGVAPKRTIAEEPLAAP